MYDGWISVNDALPIRSMKVRWLHADGKEDIGFYYKEKGECFAGWDFVSSTEITHWKPSESNLNAAREIIEVEIAVG